MLKPLTRTGCGSVGHQDGGPLGEPHRTVPGYCSGECVLCWFCRSSRSCTRNAHVHVTAATDVHQYTGIMHSYKCNNICKCKLPSALCEAQCVGMYTLYTSVEFLV